MATTVESAPPIESQLNDEELRDLLEGGFLESKEEDVSQEVLSKMNANLPSDVSKAAEDTTAAGTVTIDHKSPTMIYMYDREGNTYLVPKANMMVQVKEGRFLKCPLCKNFHTSTEVNACKGREPRQFVRCPICRNKSGIDRKIYDDGGLAEEVKALDPNELQLPTGILSTPRQRIIKNLLRHIQGKHRDEYAMYATSLTPEAIKNV